MTVGVCVLDIGPLTLDFADFPWISGDFYGMKLAWVGAFTDFGTFDTETPFKF